MDRLTTEDLEAAAELIYRTTGGPTPAYAWPLVAQRAGLEVWVKHENHTPIGAMLDAIDEAIVGAEAERANREGEARPAVA